MNKADYINYLHLQPHPERASTAKFTTVLIRLCPLQ